MYFDAQKQKWRICIDLTINGKRRRHSKVMPKGTTEQQAKAMEEKWLYDLTVQHRLTSSPAGWTRYVDGLAEKRSWLDDALQKCAHRAKTKGRECTLTRAELIELMHLSDGRCAVTGLLFSDKAMDGHMLRPFMHSIDRINSSAGYKKSNVRIVCAGVNIAMMHWGEQVFADMAVGYVMNRYSAVAGTVASIGGRIPMAIA